MSEHTPTPWRIYDDADPHHVRILGRFADIGNAHVVDILSPENAAFIVKAVNNHSSLVEALEKLLFWNEGILAGRGNHHPQDHISIIKAALEVVKS